jgi:restriction system protein
MANDWQNYQNEVTTFFRSLGLIAETDLTLQGVRTTHDVDVVVRSQHVGFTITWIVECKHWKRRVTKLHVLALREIVADLGADRGILVSEAGFQSGAVEAANLTNVHVNSLATLQTQAETEVIAMRLRELFDRVENCRQRYWDIPKSVRIEFGLRPDSGAFGYSADHVVAIANELLSKAFRGMFPVEAESLAGMAIFGESKVFSNAVQLSDFVQSAIIDLETKLDFCERSSG